MRDAIVDLLRMFPLLSLHDRLGVIVPEKYDGMELDLRLQRWLEGKNEVLCPGTCMQRGMNESRNLIDQYPVAVPAALITAPRAS